MNRRAQLALSILAIGLLAGCAAPANIAATARAATTPPAASVTPVSTATVTTALVSTAPVSTRAASASTESSATASALTGPPYEATATCPSPNYMPIYGPHVVLPTNDLARISRPFGDVGANFMPPGPGAATLPYRLDVILKRPLPDPSLSPPSAAYEAAVSAQIDSYRQLAEGTEPHVARVTLERFRQGPFVLPAGVLNALPKGRSYTVYLVSGGDMSDCSFDYVSSQLQGDFPIADLIT